MNEDRKFWIGVWLTIATIVVTAAVGIPTYLQWRSGEAQREQDLELERARVEAEAARQKRQDVAEIPRLEFVASRWDQKDALLSFVNRSTTNQHANISRVTFTIIDPDCLDRLAKVFPRPRTDPGVGASNHADNVFFREGVWLGPNYFEFCANVGLNVPPGPASELRLAIVNPKLAGQQFKGELKVDYDANGIGHRCIVPAVIYAR